VSVLTMPPEVRERYTTAAAWRLLRRKVSHLFRDEFGAAFQCIATHPVGDDDPAAFHPHLNVLWSKRTPGLGMLSEPDLERLKLRWGEILGSDRPVDVHGSFVQSWDAKRLRHRARYYCRLFVAWGRWMPKAVQWYGDYARGTVPTCCCVECGGGFNVLALGDHAIELHGRLLQAAARRRGADP